MITAICSVAFHLRDGQKIEAMWPVDALDDDEKIDVAMNSLPDSQSFELSSLGGVRDSVYQFRILRSKNEAHSCVVAKSLHGFVFCRQRLDRRLPRGGEQKAVVVLSPVPLGDIFYSLVKYAGMMVATRGWCVLEDVYNEAQSWIPLQWGSPVEFCIGSHLLQATIPCLSSLSSDSIQGIVQIYNSRNLVLKREDVLLASLDSKTGLPLSCCIKMRPKDNKHGFALGCPALDGNGGADLFSFLSGVCEKLNELWEMAMVGEPIIIIGPSPELSSKAALALTSIIAPMPYCLDYRPYFSVHDPFFNQFAKISGDISETSSKYLPRIIGITNSQILKTLYKWPNVLVAGFNSLKEQNQNESDGEWSTSSNRAINTEIKSRNIHYGNRKRWGPSFFHGILNKVPKGIFGSHSLPAENAFKTCHAEPAFDCLWSSYAPLIKAYDAKDISQMNQFVRAGDHTSAKKINNILVHHFHALTQAVLEPILKYIEPQSMVLEIHASGKVVDSVEACANHMLLALDKTKFVTEIKNGQLEVSDILMNEYVSRKKLSEFYDRFINGPQFEEWFDLRREAACAWIQHEDQKDGRF